MTQDRLNVLAMHERVLDFLNRHVSIWSSFQPIADQVVVLQNTITARRSALVQQQVQTEGITDRKKDAYRTAINSVLRITKFANSHALANHDTDLYAQTKRSRTYLRELPDDQSLAVLVQMLDAVDAQLPVLQPYGITAMDMANARMDVANAQALRNAPRSVIDTRKTAGSGVGEHQRAGQRALRIIDRTIHFFDATQPQFVTGYRNARIVIDQ
ncbi:MAG: hypothetical protein EOP52_05455 [Sphingobacteriales bacterium]|nr:MAG: hypothetical protein EOP52_05455 [Sphingobacteriales bacterium]